MKTKLLAKSSSGDSYDVEFAVEGDYVRVFCHCQAGVLQQMCKHKLALITGDTKMLFDSTQASLLAEVRAWPQFARLQARITRYVRELGEIEAAKAEVAKREKTTKAQMGKDLLHGDYVA
jgi:hypothetical protein